MMDVEDCKLFLVSPKSGLQNEVVYIPKKVAGRLREYIRSKNMVSEERIFSIGYTGARQIVKRAGRKIGLEISPHDLRRHAVTYASRAGAPIEIVSRVIFRHASLSTTQRYLATVHAVKIPLNHAPYNSISSVSFKICRPQYLGLPKIKDS